MSENMKVAAFLAIIAFGIAAQAGMIFVAVHFDNKAAAIFALASFTLTSVGASHLAQCDVLTEQPDPIAFNVLRIVSLALWLTAGGMLFLS